MKYPHAQAAAQIRKELKKNGIPAKVNSKGYAGGSSVNVLLTGNPLPATVAQVSKFADQYQMGDFDGMTDMYEYRRDNTDLPQASFVFVNTDYTDEFKQLAWDHVRATMHGGDEAPTDYTEAYNYRLQDEWGSTWVHRVLSGKYFPEFWTAHKQRIVA